MRAVPRDPCRASRGAKEQAARLKGLAACGLPACPGVGHAVGLLSPHVEGGLWGPWRCAGGRSRQTGPQPPPCRPAVRGCGGLCPGECADTEGREGSLAASRSPRPAPTPRHTGKDKAEGAGQALWREHVPMTSPRMAALTVWRTPEARLRPRGAWWWSRPSLQQPRVRTAGRLGSGPGRGGCARGRLLAKQSRRRGGLRPALLTWGSQARRRTAVDGRRVPWPWAEGGGGDLKLRGERAERDSRYLVWARQLAGLGQ